MLRHLRGRQAFTLDIHDGTFSTRSTKKSLTSFVLVNFAAMLTSPLERFWKRKNQIYVLFLIDLMRNVSHLKVSLHLSESFSLPSESSAHQTEQKDSQKYHF